MTENEKVTLLVRTTRPQHDDGLLFQFSDEMCNKHFNRDVRCCGFDPSSCNRCCNLFNSKRIHFERIYLKCRSQTE